MKKIPNYLVKVDESDQDSGVFAVSMVSSPAIKASFVALKEQKRIELSKDTQKQIVTGALLIPGQQILRIDDNNNYFTIEYSAEVIELTAQKFLKDKKLHNTTSEHEIELDGNYCVESWIVQDSKCDKSVALGLGELPVGTWCISYKINDKDYWDNEIMSGNKTGFSLEGFFSLVKVDQSQIKQKSKTNMLKKKTLQKLKDFIKSVKLEDFELLNGDILSVDDETGEAFINDIEAEDGDYETVDGETITVEDGMVELSAIKKTEKTEDAQVEPVITEKVEVKQDDVQYISRYTVVNADGTDGEQIDVQYVATAKSPTGEVMPDGQYRTNNGVTLVVKAGNVVDYLYDYDSYMSQIKEKESVIEVHQKEIETLKIQLADKETLIKQLENEPKVTSVKKSEITMSNTENLTPGQILVQKLKAVK